MSGHEGIPGGGRSNGSEAGGLRGEALRLLVQRMTPDAPWCWGWGPDGFTWLGYRMAQRIVVTPPYESRGHTVVRMSATTVVADRIPATDKLARFLNVMNRMEVGSRWLHDAETEQLLLTCHTLAHQETLPLRMSDMAGNALLQITRAEALATSGFLELLGGEPAWRSHPERGTRTEPDEMLDVLEQVVMPQGRGGSRYASAEEFAEAETSLADTPFFTLGGGADGMAAEVAAGDDTILIRLHTDVTHPVLGAGLLTTIRCRMGERGGEPGTGEDRALALVAELNRAEGELDGPGHGLGAWHTHTPEGRVAEVAHSAFIPNGFYVPGRPQDALWCAIDRAVWLSRRLVPDGDPMRDTRWDMVLRLRGDAGVEVEGMN